MSEVPYGQYDEAYKAIHSALMNIMAPSSGKNITKQELLWNTDGTARA